jgi:hypothetical protein
VESGFFRTHEEAIVLAKAKAEAEAKKENIATPEQGLRASVETYQHPDGHAKIVQISRSRHSSNSTLRATAQAPLHSTASSSSLRGIEQSQSYHSILRATQNEQPTTPTRPAMMMENRRRDAAIAGRRSGCNLRAASMSAGPRGPVFD